MTTTSSSSPKIDSKTVPQSHLGRRAAGAALLTLALAVACTKQSAEPSAMVAPSALAVDGSSPPKLDGGAACDSTNAGTISTALENAINDALAPYAGKTLSNQTQKQGSFTVPEFCDLLGFGQCFGGNTYTGTASRSTTVTGATDLTATIDAGAPDCSISNGTVTSTGTFSLGLAWTDPVDAKVKFSAEGILGASVGVTIEVDITGMTITTSGTYTITSDAAQVCTTAMQVSNCTVQGHVATYLDGVPTAPGITAKAQSRLDGAGPRVCSKINEKLAQKIPSCHPFGDGGAPPSLDGGTRPPKRDGGT
jgi:hypothetical protein